MKNKKWYSNNLNKEKIKDFQKVYGVLRDVAYREIRLQNVLDFHIDTSDDALVRYSFEKNKEDAKNLLKETNSSSVKCLEGKVVEVYFDSPMMMAQLKGISVDDFSKRINTNLENTRK